MAIDIETKRKIIELYFGQRKTICEVAKIVKNLVVT
jgi:transposase-like protein